MSTLEQDPELQHDALKGAGVERVFTDQASGALTERPQLAALLEQLRPGDTLVVWRLDRLGRSTSHLIQTVTALEERGVGFTSMPEAIGRHLGACRNAGSVRRFGYFVRWRRPTLRNRYQRRPAGVLGPGPVRN